MMDEFILFIRDMIKKNTKWHMIVPTNDTMTVEIGVKEDGMSFSLCSLNINEEEAKLNIHSAFSEQEEGVTTVATVSTSIELGNPELGDKVVEIITRIHSIAKEMDPELRKAALRTFYPGFGGLGGFGIGGTGGISSTGGWISTPPTTVIGGGSTTSNIGLTPYISTNTTSTNTTSTNTVTWDDLKVNYTCNGSDLLGSLGIDASDTNDTN